MVGRSETRRRLEQQIEEGVEDRAHTIAGHKSLLEAMLEVTEATRAEISEAVSKEVARKRA